MASTLAQRASRIRKATERFGGQFVEWIQVVHGELKAAQQELAIDGSHESQFTDWCDAEFGWSRPRVYQLIEAGEIIRILLSTTVDRKTIPANEWQCRELARVPEDDLAAIWQSILDEANGQPITRSLIHQHIAQYLPEREETPIDRQWDSMRTRIRKWAEQWGVGTPLAYLEDLIDELRERYAE